MRKSQLMRKSSLPAEANGPVSEASFDLVCLFDAFHYLTRPGGDPRCYPLRAARPRRVRRSSRRCRGSHGHHHVRVEPAVLRQRPQLSTAIAVVALKEWLQVTPPGGPDQLGRRLLDRRRDVWCSRGRAARDSASAGRARRRRIPRNR